MQHLSVKPYDQMHKIRNKLFLEQTFGSIVLKPSLFKSVVQLISIYISFFMRHNCFFKIIPQKVVGVCDDSA
jgi:hypothetical protein